MTCNACGEKPKDTAKDFTKAVIEIDNPEEVITLLRKVVIPASMGTEEQVPAAVGKYRNVILYYEANKHVYIYSSDGIPTLLEVEIPQEILDRIEALEDGLDNEIEARAEADETLQEEIDALKNSPDVVDIVPTYAALESYDTSALGDKDVIRVLADETHDGASTYYRWNLSSQTWTYIGEVGPYYTKTQTDTLLSGKQDNLTAGEAISIINDTISATNTGKARELTSDDLNWNYTSKSRTEPYTAVAVWLLPPGLYYCKPNNGLKVIVHKDETASMSGGTFLVMPRATNGHELEDCATIIYGRDATDTINEIWTGYPGGLAPFGVNKVLTSYYVKDNLTSTSATSALSANQGRVLKDMIDSCSAVKKLSSEDYNYPTSSPDGVALWELGVGVYISDANTKVWFTTSDNTTGEGVFLVTGTNSSYSYNIYRIGAWVDGIWKFTVDKTTGAHIKRVEALWSNSITVRGNGAPTTSTVGDVGHFYVDNTNLKAYICVDVTGQTYTWKQITN